MPAIYLIETANNFKVVDRDAGILDSGYWKLTLETATKLVGADIYFHSAWADASHYGGLVTGYSVHNAPGTKEHGRIILRFKQDQGKKGVVAPDGASGEKRLVW